MAKIDRSTARGTIRISGTIRIIGVVCSTRGGSDAEHYLSFSSARAVGVAAVGDAEDHHFPVCVVDPVQDPVRAPASAP